MYYLINTGDFSLVRNYLRPSNNSRQLIFSINAVKMENVNLNLSIYTVFLKNINFISKIRRSKFTDYAALRYIKERHRRL